MAKTKTSSTISPALFGLLGAIESVTTKAVPELHAYALGEAVESCGTHTFTDTESEEAVTLVGAAQRAWEFWIPSWAVQIEVRAALDVDAGITAADVDVDIGGGSATISLTSSPWEGSTTLNVSGTGSGYQLVSVGGTATGTGSARLSSLTVRVSPITAGALPDPT